MGKPQQHKGESSGRKKQRRDSQWTDGYASATWSEGYAAASSGQQDASARLSGLENKIDAIALRLGSAAAGSGATDLAMSGGIAGSVTPPPQVLIERKVELSLSKAQLIKETGFRMN